jgi:hypothetical protein
MLTETGGRVMPEAGAICWAKRNLIVGPLGNERLFDPGDSLDFESPIAMKGRRKVHVAAMVELGKLMQAFGDDKIEPKEFSVKFMKMHRHCLGRVDKRDSHGGLAVIQAGICYGDQLAPRPDERR